MSRHCVECAWMYLVACQYAVVTDQCETPAWCEACHRDGLDAEAASVMWDMTVAALVVGRRTDAATLARRAGVPCP